MEVNRYKYSEMIITDYNFLVPLDYENEDGEKISIFAREILREEYGNKHLPYSSGRVDTAFTRNL